MTAEAHGDAILVAIRRTAFGRTGGVFRSCTVDALAAPVIRSILADTGLASDAVDEVWLGNALEGGNVARRAALAAGLPVDTPAFTVDRQCSSGLDTIIDAFQLVASGRAQAILAGGVESCSTAPWRVSRPPSASAAPAFMRRAPFSAPPYADPDPIAGADALAGRSGITRAEQDAWTARSHANARTAMTAGCFRAERVPVLAGNEAETDEIPRDGMTTARLGRLPALLSGGTATVASVAPEADAAVIALVVSPAMAAELGAGRRLRLLGAARAGCDPADAGYAAVPALTRLRQRYQPVPPERVEFNEAFAGQALTCLRACDLPEDRTNRSGGALALGHPFGASGAYLVCRLFHDLLPCTPGLAAVSAMGGQGTAALFAAETGVD
ncbi:thiolase family protein [Aquisalimonas lutea]|uniref:thiolase family protein n=1 Tax=Aquisalimonas lutea TaxID=1327750 RepID=UPI0025B52451|nr:thiolase family protein [Aquisalimonas lutea]MDN3518527.1 thiolase family protein [Aquisalimonas lutea]